MAYRTTLLMDEESKTAARQLAMHYGCSVSEVVRRAVLRHRDAVLGAPLNSRNDRRKLLDRLFPLFDGHDAGEEIRRLKSEDRGF